MTKGSVAEPWYRGMESSFGGLQVVPLAPSAAEATGTFASTDLGDVGVYGISGTPQQLIRPARALRRSPTESLKVCAVRRGRCVIEQGGNEVSVGPGEFGVYDTRRPYRLIWPEAWECDVMTALPAALGMGTRTLSRVQARAWSTRTGAGAMLVHFMSSCAALPGSAGVSRNHLATAGVSLLAGVIHGDLEGVAGEAEEVFRNQVEAYIGRHLFRADLSPASIAAAHHVSLRTIQRLFAGSGTGVSGVIRQRRLEAVHRDLVDPRFATCTIAELAARWCIHDAQWLAKAFRAHFGISPSELRRSAAAKSSPARTDPAPQA